MAGETGENDPACSLFLVSDKTGPAVPDEAHPVEELRQLLLTDP